MGDNPKLKDATISLVTNKLAGIFQPKVLNDITLSKRELVDWTINYYNPRAAAAGADPINLYPDGKILSPLALEEAFAKYNEFYIHNRQKPALLRSKKTGIALVPDQFEVFNVPTKDRKVDPYIPRVHDPQGVYHIPKHLPDIPANGAGKWASVDVTEGNRKTLEDVKTGLEELRRQLEAAHLISEPHTEVIGPGNVRET